jgi:hypothetical protein
VDISAGLIRIFEHLGWATGVHWPDPDRLAAHRRGSRQDQAQPVLQTAETGAARASRDDLIDQCENARVYTATATSCRASAPADDSREGISQP